jgi:dTDP-4-dehydrorhamnose 3,5-epimerase
VKIEPLSVGDAWVCTPAVHADDRGAFLEWCRLDLLREATGRRVEVVQANHSISRRGIVRGVHYADVPPGQAKFVYCPTGAVLDVIVDLRIGSPTFGTSTSVVLDDVDRRSVFISEGLGHAFCALQDESSVNYLVSSAYNPSAERTISPLDPDLAIAWPTDVGEILTSPRDRDAPSLATAKAQGVLPSHESCVAFYASQR